MFARTPRQKHALHPSREPAAQKGNYNDQRAGHEDPFPAAAHHQPRRGPVGAERGRPSSPIVPTPLAWKEKAPPLPRIAAATDQNCQNAPRECRDRSGAALTAGALGAYAREASHRAQTRQRRSSDWLGRCCLLGHEVAEKPFEKLSVSVLAPAAFVDEAEVEGLVGGDGE
jgi:hypothetical protein